MTTTHNPLRRSPHPSYDAVVAAAREAERTATAHRLDAWLRTLTGVTPDYLRGAHAAARAAQRVVP